MSFSPFPSPSRSLLAAFSFSLTFSSTKTKGSPTSTLLLSQLLSHLIYRCQPFRHPLVVSLYASCKILHRRCGMQDSPFSVFFFITTHFLFRDCFDRIAFVVVHFHWMVEGTYLVHISYLSRTHLVPISYTSRTYLVHISHLSRTHLAPILHISKLLLLFSKSNCYPSSFRSKITSPKSCATIKSPELPLFL